MKFASCLSLTIAVLCLSTLSFAAGITREVKHAPGAGQYATITAALADSVNGDTIEIVDNTAPFAEAVFFDGKTDITIQGAATLDPRPTLQGVANTYVVAGERGLYPNGATISGQNANYGNIIKNLIIDGTANSMIVDVRFSVKELTNVDIITGPNTVQTILSSGGNLSMTNCTITGNPAIGLENWGGVVTMDRVKYELTSTSGLVLHLYVGAIHATNCWFSTASPNVIKTEAFEEIGNGIDLNLSGCMVRSKTTGGGVPVLVDLNQVTPTHSRQHTALFDHCDFIGSQEVNPTPTLDAISINNMMDNVTITNSIFYRTLYGPFSNNIGSANISEDYNVYKKTDYASNEGGMAGITKGSHSVLLADGDKLYADDLGGSFKGDFRLDQQSVAAEINNTVTPVYAGSQGLHPTVPVELSSFSIN